MTYFLSPIKISREVLALRLAGCTHLEEKGAGNPLSFGARRKEERENSFSGVVKLVFVLQNARNTKRITTKASFERERAHIFVAVQPAVGTMPRPAGHTNFCPTTMQVFGSCLGRRT